MTVSLRKSATSRSCSLRIFVPFNQGEQAVLVHRGLLALKDKLRQPVKLGGGSLNPIGRVNLTMQWDARICRQLAQDHYMSDLGARSLRHGVNRVREWVYEKYLQMEAPIEETGRVENIAIMIYNKVIEVTVAPSSRKRPFEGAGTEGTATKIRAIEDK